MSLSVPPSTRPRRDPFRWVVEHPGEVDGVIFGGAAVFLLLAGVVGGTIEFWWVFTVPMVALGAFGRTRPGLSALLIGILAVLHFVLGALHLGSETTAVLGDAMIFYALFCATAHGSVRTGRLALAAAALGALLQAGAVATLFLSPDPRHVLELVTAFVMSLGVGLVAVAGTWALGRYQHARIDQMRLARERAEQAEREREQRAALAVADERARIAREMHDVVAHSLSVIIAQADGGRFIASRRPEKAAEVLETIGTTGRAALADMRSLLGVLRHEEETSFGPQPDLTTLPELLARVRATGLTVEADLTGDLANLPPALGLSMFRLVQEALTNVLKHAGPAASARVAVHRTPGRLAIDVTDDGRGTDPDSDGHGHGLTGMRERVTLHGGTLAAGPLPAGGFRVSARIPLGVAPPRPRAARPALGATRAPLPTPAAPTRQGPPS